MIIKIFKIIFALGLAISITGCKKDSTQSNGSTLTISNLHYDPSTVTIKQTSTTITIYGTIDFVNASGGVAKFRLTTSTGSDLTMAVPSNSLTNGTLSGTFQVVFPATAGTFTFQLWIIDNGGNSSNKLQGSVQAVIDDSGTGWSVISQSWPLFRVIWTNQTFMAVGDGGTILHSPDGITWTQVNAGTSVMLYGLTWSGTQYIVVGAANTILSSPDGITWTSQFSGGGGIVFYSVAWSGTGYVAVGQDNTNSKTVICNSADGITWTNNGFVVSGGNLNTVIWANHQYVAVGKVSGAPLILTSPNGRDWTNRSSTINMGMGIELNDITWTGSFYAAVGFGITATSQDGITWIVNDKISWGATGVVWSGNRLMASGISGIYSSIDGINWTKTFDSPYPLRSITWSGLQYISVGFISPIIMTSPP